jgi:dihydrofolate reductase
MNIVILGSGALVRALVDDDLVDEYRLMVHPIMLGGGKRLFGDAHRVRRLRLVDSKATGTGSLILKYQPA